MSRPSVSGLLWRCEDAVPTFVCEVLGERQQERLCPSVFQEAVAPSRADSEVTLTVGCSGGGGTSGTL